MVLMRFASDFVRYVPMPMCPAETESDHDLRYLGVDESPPWKQGYVGAQDGLFLFKFQQYP